MYRLKKWYPSLPKDWEVGMEVGQDDRFKSYYSPCNGKYKEFFVNFEQVEQNEEFWEEVVEKDYEILSLSFGDGIYLKTGKKVSSFPYEGLYNEFRAIN